SGTGVSSPGYQTGLVQTPSRSVERIASRRPAGSPEASTVIGYGPSLPSAPASMGFAPIRSATLSTGALAETTSTRSARGERAAPRPPRPRADPPPAGGPRALGGGGRAPPPAVRGGVGGPREAPGGNGPGGRDEHPPGEPGPD